MRGIAIFLTIALSIVIAGHALLYFSWLKFFNVSDPRTMRALGFSLGLLSISFLAASLIIHRFDNGFTQSLYILSSVWLGVLLYLFLGSILGWLIFLFLKITGHVGLMKTAAIILGALVAIYSAYGLWNAHYPRVKKIEVAIKNLPPSWSGKTAVQITDLHLGAIRGKGFLEKVVRAVNSVKPDIVFITGDLFDGAGDDLIDAVSPIKQIESIYGIYYIFGNHETYLGTNKAMAALKGTPVRLLRNELVTVDGLQILGINYPHSGENVSLETVLQQLDSSKPNIVLFHSPVHIPLFKKYGVNLQLAGHTHRGQLWPLNYITNRVYDGYDRGLHIEDGYTLYTSVGTGTWGPPMRTGNSPEVTVISLK